MPRNSSGIYTLPGGNPVTPGTVIEASWANTTMEDLGDALTNSLSRTGAGGMLAPFRIADGAVTAPGLSYLNETNTGLYRSGSGSVWMSVLGVNTVQFSTVGLTIPSGKALTNQGATYLTSTLAVTGATTMASTLAVTGAITATGGVIGNVTGNVTSAGTSTFGEVIITGSLDMTAGSAATITGLSTPTNASDAANKGYVDTQDALKLSLTGGTMTGAIAMTNTKITGLATPTADQDAATKAYVDSVAQGLDAKASCRASTTANITLSGAQTIDGVAVIAGDRVLVQNQSSAAQNGIYVASASTWARSSDASTWDSLVSAFTFIESGTVNGNNGYICTIAPGGTLGTTPVTWAQFSGAGQITAGTGMSKTGNTLNVNTASASRIVVGADEIDLATTGVTASTYQSVTVDAFGRVTGGTNPTTLAGYNISNAYTIAQVDAALALKLNLTGGTMSGVIAMGANKITGLADPTVAQDAATKNYIDTIFGSTTTAAASATAAAASATAAAASASNAATSATNSATSATNSAASYTTFNNQYLGSLASNPTVNNTGGALVAGNLYWNSTVSEMRVYSGSAWVAAYLPASGYLALTGGTMTGAITFAGAQTWPTFNQNTTGTAAGLSSILAVASGGTGTATPSIVAGTNVTVTGTWPNQTIAASGGGASAATPTALGTVYGNTTSTAVTTALGYNAGLNNTGGQTTAVGFEALKTNTSGANNAAFGAYALHENSTGFANTATGISALYNTTTGDSNVASGWQSLFNNTTGTSSVALGYRSLYSNTTASNGTAVGYQAAYSVTTVSGITAIGYQAGYSDTNPYGAFDANTYLGYRAGYNTTTANAQTFIGTGAGFNKTTGALCTLVGSNSGYALTTGAGNTCLGYGTMINATTISYSVAIGDRCMGAGVATGTYNVGVGQVALQSLSSGSNNCGVGFQALNGVTSANNNTSLGADSGYGVTTGTDNVFVGKGAGSNLTTGQYSIYIGQGAQPSAASNSSELVIGAQATGKGSGTSLIYGGSGGAYQGNNSATWSVISDQRLKKNIVNNNVGLDAINAIRVCNFEYRIADEVTELPQNQAIKKTGIQLGAIAQELQVILPDCVKQESTGVLSVNTDNLTWYMINAIKELKAQNDSLQTRLTAANL